MARRVVLYHANCNDGFCAAYLLWKKWSTPSGLLNLTIFLPIHYGEPVPSDLKLDDIVYLVDFSLKQDAMAALLDKVAEVWVLDHHKTAEKELEPFKGHPKAFIFFDMNRCGAKLVEDFLKWYVHKKQGLTIPTYQNPSRLVTYIQDRDLWLFKLTATNAISAYIRSFEFTFLNWKNIENTVNNNISEAIEQGEAILRFQERQIEQSVVAAAIRMFPPYPNAERGVAVPVVNAVANFSEVGEALCIKYKSPFSVCWFQRKDGKFQYSLRSRSGYDVSELAKTYGGGGHQAAAGFESDILILGGIVKDGT